VYAPYSALILWLSRKIHFTTYAPPGDNFHFPTFYFPCFFNYMHFQIGLSPKSTVLFLKQEDNPCMLTVGQFQAI